MAATVAAPACRHSRASGAGGSSICGHPKLDQGFNLTTLHTVEMGTSGGRVVRGPLTATAHLGQAQQLIERTVRKGALMRNMELPGSLTRRIREGLTNLPGSLAQESSWLRGACATKKDPGPDQV